MKRRALFAAALAGLAAPVVKKAPVAPPRRWDGMGFYDTLVPVEFKALAAGPSFRYNALLEVWERRGASNPLFKGGTLADVPPGQFYIAGKV